MKLHPDSVSATSISSYGPGWIAIAGERVGASVVLGSRGQRFAWNCDDFMQLGPDHFTQLADLDTELVIFGSGSRLRFPQAAWLQALIARRIGVETMDTQAACRTYNILVAEGRNVAVALLIEHDEG